MKIKILFWNIWVNNNFVLVKDFLNTCDADIIGLQEVSGNDSSRDTIKYLSSLGYKYVYAPQARPWSDGREDGPAIFCKYEIVSSKKFVISEENGVGAVQADIKIDKTVYHIFSTHLSHTHQQESAFQVAQVEKVLSFIPSGRSILMGDFNAIPISNTIQKIKEKLADTDTQNSPTWSVYPEGCQVCKPMKINTRLDYIFASPEIVTHSYKVEDSKGSYHLPISAILGL